MLEKVVLVVLAVLAVFEGLVALKKFTASLGLAGQAFLAILVILMIFAIVRHCLNWLMNRVLGPLRHAGCKNYQMEKFRRYTTSEHELIGISCENCSMEWVRAEFVLPQNRGEEMLLVEGEKLYVIDRPSDQSASKLITYAEITNLTDLSRHLKVGDHIKHSMKLQPGYHHAIVEEVQKVDGSCDIVTLIHWQGIYEGFVISMSEGACIKRDTIHDMRKRADKLYRCDYRVDKVREDNRELTLARANAWVGERQVYDLTRNNCEHFAFFCKTGLWQSDQIEFTASVIMGITRFLYVDYQDITVDAYYDLSPGDHIIMFMTMIHPRCHMIVKSINKVSGVLTVIRFTYKRGVVEERLKFRRTCKKIISYRPFTPQVVLERANAALKEGTDQPYSIIKFNCKHFAFLITRGYRTRRP